MALTLRVGDVVRMKKAHPCGGYHWRVGRLGADIGLTCQTCGRHIMAARSYLERRVKGITPREMDTKTGTAPGQEQAGTL